MISTKLTHAETIECVEILSNSIAMSWLRETLGIDLEVLSQTLTVKAFAQYEQMSDKERLKLVRDFQSRRARAAMQMTRVGQQQPDEDFDFPI